MIVFGQLIKAASCQFRARTKNMEIDARGAELREGRRADSGRCSAVSQQHLWGTVGGFGKEMLSENS